jgi:hypothetical protein
MDIQTARHSQKLNAKGEQGLAIDGMPKHICTGLNNPIPFEPSPQ